MWHAQNSFKSFCPKNFPITIKSSDGYFFSLNVKEFRCFLNVKEPSLSTEHILQSSGVLCIQCLKFEISYVLSIPELGQFIRGLAPSINLPPASEWWD